MFSEAIHKSNIIELIDEHLELDEETELPVTCRLHLRVKDRKRWAKLLIEIHRDNHDEEDFGFSVQQQYYWDEDQSKVLYHWVIFLWGDLEDAVEVLTPYLSKRSGPPPAPIAASIPVAPGGGRMATILQRETRTTESGLRVETKIALPHRSAPRNIVQKKTRDVIKERNAKGAKAFVDGVEQAEQERASSWAD